MYHSHAVHKHIKSCKKPNVAPTSSTVYFTKMTPWATVVSSLTAICCYYSWLKLVCNHLWKRKKKKASISRYRRHPCITSSSASLPPWKHNPIRTSNRPITRHSFIRVLSFCQLEKSKVRLEKWWIDLSYQNNLSISSIQLNAGCKRLTSFLILPRKHCLSAWPAKCEMQEMWSLVHLQHH
jgi:hypothetical protein